MGSFDKALWDTDAEHEAPDTGGSGSRVSAGERPFFTNALGGGGRQAEEDLAALIRAQLRGEAGGGAAEAEAPEEALEGAPEEAPEEARKDDTTTVSDGQVADATAADCSGAPKPLRKAQQRLAELRARLGKGRRENSKETYWEARRVAGAGDDGGSAGRAAMGKRTREAGGGTSLEDIKDVRDAATAVGGTGGLLDEAAAGALAAASKRQRRRDREAAGHFGWDQYNAGKAIAEYGRDVAAIAPTVRTGGGAASSSSSHSAAERAEAVVPQLASVARVGAADYADDAAVAAVAARIEGKIGSGIGRVRKVKQDEAPTYINDRNRRMNNLLEKHYGKFVAETKEDLERGTAL